MIPIRGTDQILAFGNANKQWREIKEAMLPGDKLYFVVHRKGRFYMDEHVQVRDGCVINSLLGSMS